MTRSVTTALALTLSLAAVGSPALAQAPAATAPPATPPAASEADKASIEPELTAPVYTYEVGGRRDPFRSLLLRNTNEKQGERPPGLPGMMVEELELQGTIKTAAGWVAMMRGTDNRSYLLKKGTTVFDGEVTDITPSEVTFRQNVNDPTNPKPFRDVVKALSLQRSKS